MPSDTSPLFASLDGLHVTPWIWFEDFMVTSGRKVPPWAWALWCVLLISLQDQRLYFPSCQQTPLNMKPSSRIALAEEALCPISLSLPKGSLQTMTGQCRAIRPPPLTPTRGKSSLRTPCGSVWGVTSPASPSCAILLSSLRFHVYRSWDPSPGGLLHAHLGLGDCPPGTPLPQGPVLAWGICVYLLLILLLIHN